jgi:hypothetical protein
MKVVRKLFGVTLAAVAVAVAAFAGGTAAQAQGPPQYKKMTNIWTNKCLDVRTQDNALAQGARIQQWRCSGADEQQFALWYVGINYAGIDVWQLKAKRSGLCMTPPNNASGVGVQMVQQTCAIGPNDWNARGALWLLTIREHRSDGRMDFVFFNNWSKLCLDLSGGSSSDGAKIQQYTCNGTDAQHWLW